MPFPTTQSFAWPSPARLSTHTSASRAPGAMSWTISATAVPCGSPSNSPGAQKSAVMTSAGSSPAACMACQSPKPRSMTATVTPLPAVPFAIQLAAPLSFTASSVTVSAWGRTGCWTRPTGPGLRKARDRLRGHARLDEIAVAVEDGAAGGAHGLDGRGRVTRLELNLDGGRGCAQPEPSRLADRGARAVVPSRTRDSGERRVQLGGLHRPRNGPQPVLRVRSGRRRRQGNRAEREQHDDEAAAPRNG